MKRHHRVTTATSMLLGVVAITLPSGARAQDTGGLPRTVNERVVTETPTPPPVNSDARRAADGQLVPGGVPVQGAADPARALGTTGAARDRAMDPAMRLNPAVVAPGRMAAYPDGMDAAILAEHALSMAIEGSALRTIAERSTPIPAGDNSATMLLGHADRMMAESQAILGRGAVDTRETAAKATRRFNLAAREYVAALAALNAAPPADKTQAALIGHAVKQVLDADHIRQMGYGSPAGPAMEQLMAHARTMKDQGTQTLLRLAGNAPIDPNATTRVTTLARRGREVIDAAGELGAVIAARSAVGVAPAATTAPLPNGPNPGRFQDNRPEIIGGTFGTSNPTTGTYTGKGDPLNPGGVPVINNDGAPIPSPRDRTNPTGSNGGLPPR